MNEKLIISVIIPAYNAEEFLQRSIKSVLAQILQPVEILVIDDGSKDKTASIARQFTDSGQQVKYIYQENSGAAAARNTGISSALGEWIAFLDADDEWLPHHLENAAKILQLHPALKWYGAPVNQYIHLTGKLQSQYKKKSPGILTEEAYFADYMFAFPPYAHFSTPTMIIHQSVFKKVGLFDENLTTGEDLDLWYRIGLQFPKVGYCHEVAANIYKRSTSLSHTNNRDFRKSLAVFREREQLAKSLGKEVHRRVEPRIMYWVTKLLKANLSQGNTAAVREIVISYQYRLSVHWYWFARIYLLAPWAINLVFTLRNSITKRNKPPK